VTLATFIDLQKAFDKVWKDGLQVKLLRSGIQGKMYRWTKSYLHNRRARVQVDGQCGRKVLLRQGVPQGGVLSPTLFILFINDLVPELPKGVHAALYADDLVLWCCEEYATTATYRMQHALDKVAAWANDWRVTINREKTTATLFSLSPKQKPGKLTLQGSQLQFQDQQTYLGVTFDKRMTWKPHIQDAESKARRKLNIMRKLAGTQWGANENILRNVYQGTVRPHLEYSSCAWMTAAKTHQQNMDRVQNQALRIITGGMRSTPIHTMEKKTGIPPLCERRDCRAMQQANKFKHSIDHPMKARLEQLSSGRLKRSSFAKETAALNTKHKAKLPEVTEAHTAAVPAPWDKKPTNFTISSSVPYLLKKEEQSNEIKKALTLAMLEEKYPADAWIRAFTDGSATNATERGGAGVYIQYPNGQWQAEAKATGLHCTNYRSEEEALISAANIISCKAGPDDQVVFLTDALSVLQAIPNNKVPRLENALQNVKCLRTVVQWIPSHCGIEGNEEADRMAKLGAEDDQEENKVNPAEMNTIIKSLYGRKKLRDRSDQLTRKGQVVIFRLRTGHCRLKQHLHQKFRVVPSPMCNCGTAEETVDHVLQNCKRFNTLRKEIWPHPVPLQEKLHGTLEELRKTVDFVSRTDLQI